ncbi:MAG TPA: DNA-3-methyladenine glycosylase I [Thermoplasmata archaeon]|nr:DNA-3-methyladenine glycosylase I [Thermoplasmata archaeon]
MKKRCPWADTEDPLYLEYHDKEWGVPIHDDRRLFEFLVLEGAQAGLSWNTILRRRENYRRAFASFDPKKVAAFNGRKVEKLLEDTGIIRNRRKVESTISNAKALLAVQKEYGSFDSYVWSFVGGRPIINKWRSPPEVPVASPEARTMSANLIKRGFRFVGPTICYAYMQAVGLVNDHLVCCFRYSEIR